MEYTEAWKLTIYIADDDRHGRKPLSRCVIKLLLEEGICGASVLHGTKGYGSDTGFGVRGRNRRVWGVLEQDLFTILNIGFREDLSSRQFGE